MAQRKDPGDYELIKTIEPARSFAEDAEDDQEDSGARRKLPMVEL